MNETTLLPVLGVLLALASVWDATLHRIPNALVVGIAATGAFAHALQGDAGALGSGALSAVVVGALVWPAWNRRWIGGGDLKLAAAAAVWLGIARVPHYLLASAAAIGVVALFSYALSARAVRGEIRQNLALAARGVAIVAPLGSEGGRVQVPAGVGFAVGALLTLLTNGGR